MIKKAAFILAFFLFLPLTASAEMKVRESGGMLYVENATVKETE